jgi:hypothetical protein
MGFLTGSSSGTEITVLVLWVAVLGSGFVGSVSGGIATGGSVVAAVFVVVVVDCSSGVGGGVGKDPFIPPLVLLLLLQRPLVLQV